MNAPEKSWETYSIEPLYDEHPWIGTYNKHHLCYPRVGDYLIVTSEEEFKANHPEDYKNYSEIARVRIDRPTSDEFDDEYLSKMPSIAELLARGVIVEVPDDLRSLDYHLQQNLAAAGEELYIEKDGLDRLMGYMRCTDDKGFREQIALEAEKEYWQLKPQARVMEARRKYAAAKTELQHKVVGPLLKLMEGKQSMNEFREKVYRKFQMQWLIDHGFTMTDIFRAAEEWRANETEDYSFESYLEEHGFQGSIYPCADEFLGAEYQKRDYIRTILPDDNDYVEYLKDIGWLTLIRKDTLADMEEKGLLPIIRFWSNGCGELHHFGEYDITEEELPPELKPYWEEYICDGYVYLVNFPGPEGEKVNGIALTMEYGVACEFSGTEKEWDRAMAASLESAFADVIKLSALPEFQDAKVYLLEESGFDSRHELFVAFRASTEQADASISVDELKASILLFYKIMTA